MSHTTSVHRDFDHYRFIDDASTATSDSLHRSSVPSTTESNTPSTKQPIKFLEGREKLAEWLSHDQSTCTIPSPFGDRRMLYADWAASGRPLQSVEQSMIESINPLYGNTHTAASYTGLSSTCLREEARTSVHQAFRLIDDDCLLFVGNGATDAFNCFINIVDQHIQSAKQSNNQSNNQPVAVFIMGPYHHHSILLPIRERHQSIKLVSIDQSLSGGPDLDQLNKALNDPANQSMSIKVCVMSSASNLTGYVTDQSINRTIKRAGFWSVWDHAGAASFIPPQMNVRGNQSSSHTNDQWLDSKDVMCLSGHKLLGGPGTPGVLTIKKHILTNRVPHRPGGGAVFFVNSANHRYLQNFIEREESGTPNVLGSIRLGMIVQLIDQFDSEWKADRTIKMTERLYSGLRENKQIVIADDHPSSHHSVTHSKNDQSVSRSIRRLPIISFLIRPSFAGNRRDRFLHPNYVSALLNDLFGIQSRSGCMCVGPYAHDCLGINQSNSNLIEDRLIERHEILRPGFTRISLSISHSDQDIDFITQSIQWIADHGHRLLSMYAYHADTGEWRHVSRINKFVGRVWIRDLIQGIKNQASVSPPVVSSVNQSKQSLPDFSAMLSLADAAAVHADKISDLNSESPLETHVEAVRWFCIKSDLNNQSSEQSQEPLVIQPGTWPLNKQSDLSNEQSSNHAECLPCMMPRKPVQTTVDNTTSQQNGHVDTQTSTETISQSQEETINNQSLGDELTSFSNDDDQSATQSTHRSDRLTSSRCSVCYHFHLTSTANGRCTACDCVHFTPSSDQLITSSIHEPINQSKELASLSKKLHSLVGSAIRTYGMINAGDRVLVGVSGGKDSLTLIHLLLSMQRKSPVKFKIGAVTVDPQAPEYDPSSLKSYFASLNVPYFYESQDIINQAKVCMTGKKSICAYCARMKRGILYGTCRREGYNVLALGQHGDDLVESCLMSMFHNGKLRTMKANYTIGEQDLRVIRPLVHVREKMTRSYARLTNLPVIPESCPACFEAPKERARIKKLVANQEALHPNCVSHMLRAIEPLIAIKKTGVEGHIYQADSDDEA